MFQPKSMVLAFILALSASLLTVVPVLAQGTCGCKTQRLTGISMRGKTVGEAQKNALLQCPNPVNNCEKGYVCPKKEPACRTDSFDVDKVIDDPENPGTRIAVVSFDCKAKNPAVKCVKDAKVVNDPHFTGFDGVKFDFHGMDGHKYVLFGHPKGDLLVAEVRKARIIKRLNRVATYLSSLGIQTSGSNGSIEVGLVRGDSGPSQWRPQVMLNGKVIQQDTQLAFARISISYDGAINVRTATTSFEITAERLETRQHHLDVHISVLEIASTSEPYMGILGTTLDRSLGKDIPRALRPDWKGANLESLLQKHFLSDSLFPLHPPNSTEDPQLPISERMAEAGIHYSKLNNRNNVFKANFGI